MPYAQRNYNELQGSPTGRPLRYRINQIGCFLTSFSNLLERFGKGMSPLDLNRGFKNAGVYVDIDDGVLDDLAWNSVQKYNGNIVVTGTGVGKPPHNNCIVKFITNTNNFGTHFSLVADAKAGTIVDSWDGQVKSWSIYGGPKAWASYEDRTPAPTPPPAPQPQPVQDNGEFVVVQPGWGISHVAKAVGYMDFATEGRWNAIAQLNGHSSYATYKLNPGDRVRVKSASPPPAPVDPGYVVITVQAGWGISHVLKAAGYPEADGWRNPAQFDKVWAFNGGARGLNPGDQIKVPHYAPITPPAPAPEPIPVPVAPTPVPTEVVAVPAVEDNKVEVKVEQADPNAWQKTYKPFSKVYYTNKYSKVYDLAGVAPEGEVWPETKINGAGEFEKDGKRYVRTQRSVETNVWYGIPVEILSTPMNPDNYVGPLDESDDDDSIFNFSMDDEIKDVVKNLSNREQAVRFIASFQGAFISMLKALKLYKK